MNIAKARFRVIRRVATDRDAYCRMGVTQDKTIVYAAQIKRWYGWRDLEYWAQKTQEQAERQIANYIKDEVAKLEAKTQAAIVCHASLYEGFIRE